MSAIVGLTAEGGELGLDFDAFIPNSFLNVTALP